ncbi:GLPGLI family protein [Bacteroides sp.]|uniref:GLPGLI family protein n=1 Tax=Bacteroides sp. TaxID=29523 RepID=UPI003AB3BDDE
MKRRISLTALLALTALTMQAQVNIRIGTGKTFRKDTIDQAVYRVQYEVDGCTDTLKKERFQETMMLEVGRKCSKFYSYTKFVGDSVLAADIANNVSREVMIEHSKQFGDSRLNEQIYKRYPAGRVTTLDEIAGDINRLRCEETEERPAWTLTADTATILSYLCTRAECRFKGREWTAWFTPDIPSSEGPWELFGLPGLILKATDSEGHYTFTCTGIEQCRDVRPLLFDGRDYEPVNRKAYNKIHERYYADPIGFIASSAPNVSITMRDDQGNPTKAPKNMPYNPLGRE